MKPVFLLAGVILLYSFCISCRGENNKQKVNSDSTGIKADRGIGVRINAIVPKDDVFEVYYFEAGQEKFDSQDYIGVRVKGSPSPQDIKFILPPDIYPERLRLDFGKRTDQGVMKLNSVSLFYGEKNYNFSRSELVKEFKPSKYMSFNTRSMSLETEEIEGRYDPYLYSKKVNNIVNFLVED